jgi:lysophospholipase L1-like esterase
MTATSSQLLSDVAQLHTDSGLMRRIVHGPASGDGSTVETDGGSVKTIARVIAEVPSAQADREAADASASAAASSAAASAAARDAAQLSGKVYSTVAAGMAATPSGGYFSVVAADSSQYLILCQNNNGSMVQIKVYPSSAAVDGVAAEVQGARAGSPDLNTRLNAIVRSVGGNQIEVQNARGGSATLGARLDAIVESTGSTQISFAGLQGQLQTYRPTVDEVRLDLSNPVDVDPALHGFTVTLPELIISRYDGDILVPSAAVTFDAVASASITDEPFTLHYDAGGPVNFPGDRLAYLDVSGLTLKRASDNAVLGSPGDFMYKDGSGMVWGTRNVADYACKATYTGYGRRYDRVCVNSNTGVVSIVKGTNRIVDPSEYRPAEPDGLRTIYWAYVDYRGVTLRSAHAFRGFARIGVVAADHARHLEYCRARLSKTIGRAMRGQAIKLIGYGDSITAQGGGNPANDGSVGNQLAPNLDRDKLDGYYITDSQPEVYGRMPADTQALYPKYDHGDGLGQVHVHLGWNWYLKAALESLGGTVTYRNWGVGGTTSENSITSNLYNGRYPARLNAATGDGGNLAVIAFGMNELGQPSTFANVVAIIRAFQATSHECIVVTPPMISSFGLRAPITQWRDTTHQLIEAARTADCAFVNGAMIEDFPGFGITGIPQQDAAWINGFNHPGPTQLSYIGRALAELVGVRLPQGWL